MDTGTVCATERDTMGTNENIGAASNTRPQTWLGFFQALRRFVGPGMLVAVGYMDPGNWATDVAGGSQFQYRLLSVVLLASLMAMLLQHLCVRLGTVTGVDLAHACRLHCHPVLNIILYILCEFAIIATDLAEVIGSAIGLNLLFKIPLFWGIIITAGDVLILLLFYNSKNLRYFELGVGILVVSIGVCFAVLLGYTKPYWPDVFFGYIPTAEIVTRVEILYVAIGIIGATVMPHNLYLHSNLVLHRSHISQLTLGDTQKQDSSSDDDEKQFEFQPLRRLYFLPDLIRMSTIDSTWSLSLALLINSAILIVAAAAFGTLGIAVDDLFDAHKLLGSLVSPVAGTLFAVALLCSGQSSTITGTMAGQIVMEGFLGLKMKKYIKPWMRRLITRLVSIIPALVVVLVFGEEKLSSLLVLSQVVLSLQLPFAVWPLVYFTSLKKFMTVKFKRDEFDVPEERLVTEQTTVVEESEQSVIMVEERTVEPVVVKSFASPIIITVLAVLVGLLITGFNIVLLVQFGTAGFEF